VAVTSNHVKIVAIAALVVLEIANLFTARYDGNILLSIGAIIGGIAGYEFRKHIIEKKG